MKEEDKSNRGFTVVDKRVSTLESNEIGEPTPVEQDKPSYVLELERRIADRERRLKEIASSHDASVADFENARDRIRRQAETDAERNRRNLIVEFLDVVDNLERALEAAKETRDFDNLVSGLELIRDMFYTKLKGFGVSRLEAMGSRFDPAKHEALTMVPVDDSSKDGCVVGVIKDGYIIGDEVLRPASVAVAQAPKRSSDSV